MPRYSVIPELSDRVAGESADKTSFDECRYANSYEHPAHYVYRSVDGDTYVLHKDGKFDAGEAESIGYDTSEECLECCSAVALDHQGRMRELT